MALALPTIIRGPSVNYSCTTHLFDLLGDAASHRLTEIESQLMMRGGTVLFREDQAANRLFIVCEGQLKLSSTSPDGRVMILRLVGAGDILGLSAALNRTDYELTAETLRPTIVKYVSRVDFLDLLGAYREVGVQTARALARKCVEARRDTIRLGLPGSAAGRLATLLLDWVSSTGYASHEREFTMVLTHEELANMAGMSRETATRLLNQFERIGLISRQRTSFVILDAERLALVAA